MKDNVTDAAVWLPLGTGTSRKSKAPATNGEHNTQRAQSNTMEQKPKTILRKGGQQWQTQQQQPKKTQ
jgi:hypothetical protein